MPVRQGEMKMKLQINDAGSWRHVLTFKENAERDVRVRAVKLICIVNEHAKLRILDDKGDVKATSQPPNFEWIERQ